MSPRRSTRAAGGVPRSKRGSDPDDGRDRRACLKARVVQRQHAGCEGNEIPREPAANADGEVKEVPPAELHAEEAPLIQCAVRQAVEDAGAVREEVLA